MSQNDDDIDRGLRDEGELGSLSATTCDPDPVQRLGSESGAPAPSGAALSCDSTDQFAGSGPARNAEGTTIVEPRCTMCTLPPDLLAIAKAMRFEQGLSGAKIAVAMNQLIEDRKLEKRVAVRGVSHHFAHHGSATERQDYRHATFGAGSRELNLAGPPEQALAVLNDERFRRLQELTEFVLESTTERFETELLHLESAILPNGLPGRARALAAVNQTGRTIMSAVELSRRLAGGHQADAVALRTVFRSFVDAVSNLVGAAVESCATVALSEIPPESCTGVRTRLNEVVANLANAMRAVASDYEAKVGAVRKP